ncbi:hypothetical protein WS96_28275 [Burkholderia sp. MSMB1835]|nr:hypothetical protein WS96_28275 [Burkholderia sp. MSMB1835]
MLVADRRTSRSPRNLADTSARRFHARDGYPRSHRTRCAAHGLHGDDGQIDDLHGARTGTVHPGLGRWHDARTDNMAATVDLPLHHIP